jgi:acyl carrier protein
MSQDRITINIMHETKIMLDYQTLLLKLYDMVRPFTSGDVDLNEATDLIEDLGLDSMKIMDLLSTIEDSLDISLPLNILPDIHTIKDFAEQAKKLLAEG